MTPELRESIASLTRNPAYLYVLDQVATGIQDTERHLEDAVDNDALLASARQWQACRRILRILREVPQLFREEIKLEREETTL